MENSLNFENFYSLPEVGDGGYTLMDADRSTKKVRFKEGIEEEISYMQVKYGSEPTISWKDKLLGLNPRTLDIKGMHLSGVLADDDLEFLEGDIHRSVINGVHAIDFSERVKQILFKEWSLRLWNTSKHFHLMDIENGYFLAKLQSTEDYVKVLSQRPWVIYGQYLTVQPWTKEFKSLQPYPSLVLAWIRLPGLSGYLKKKILEAIGETINKVVHSDFNTDSGTRYRFARMAVYINIKEPLIGQVLVNGLYQKVEYEGLPYICFSCGWDAGAYRPWIVVERKFRRNIRSNKRNVGNLWEGRKSGSRFESLENMKALEMDEGVIKVKERQSAELKDIFKAGRFLEQIREKNRGSLNPKGDKQIGKANMEAGLSFSTNIRSNGSNPVDQIQKGDGCNIQAGPTDPSMALDAMNNSIRQPNIALRPSTSKANDQANISEGQNIPLNNSNPNFSSSAGSIILNLNFDNSSPFNNSHVNPIFDGQEESIEDGSKSQIKPNALVPKPIRVQVVDSSGGLNSNKHSAVSFNVKGTTEGNISKSNVSYSSINKTRNMVKLMGSKDQGFRTTKKINKITHGKLC
ncbi:hypothetical protein J1N35_019998 [Gossypium stocksii]|uniref:DUF4283 domain-containing protein n=1 Tax=Gossypium stocksii TaxID=47602 RepID=A0A9D3VDB5_9ROSI|nr:hypothetical protein J1N35_019998 [Gossypium stocksii]